MSIINLTHLCTLTGIRYKVEFNFFPSLSRMVLVLQHKDKVISKVETEFPSKESAQIKLRKFKKAGYKIV